MDIDTRGFPPLVSHAISNTWILSTKMYYNLIYIFIPFFFYLTYTVLHSNKTTYVHINYDATNRKNVWIPSTHESTCVDPLHILCNIQQNIVHTCIIHTKKKTCYTRGLPPPAQRSGYELNNIIFLTWSKLWTIDTRGSPPLVSLAISKTWILSTKMYYNLIFIHFFFI